MFQPETLLFQNAICYYGSQTFRSVTFRSAITECICYA